MKAKEYKPTVINIQDSSSSTVFVQMLIEGHECHGCKKIMIVQDSRHLFPQWTDLNQNAQMQAGDLVYFSIQI